MKDRFDRPLKIITVIVLLWLFLRGYDEYLGLKNNPCFTKGLIISVDEPGYKRYVTYEYKVNGKRYIGNNVLGNRELDIDVYYLVQYDCENEDVSHVYLNIKLDNGEIDKDLIRNLDFNFW